MKGLWLLLVAVLFAAPAAADLWVENCTEASVDCAGAADPYDCCTGPGAGCPIGTTTGVVGATTIGKNDLACWTYDNADGVTDSPAFTISAASAVICFDPDTRGAPVGVAPASITVYHCMAGAIAQAANPDFACMSTGTLDGTEGDAATQNACRRYGPGVFYIESTAACEGGAAPDACRVSIKGEEDVQ